MRVASHRWGVFRQKQHKAGLLNVFAISDLVSGVLSGSRPLFLKIIFLYRQNI